MNAWVKRLHGRRDRQISKEKWGMVTANDNIADPLFGLEQRINAHHKAIAHLMHLRNDYPENERVSLEIDTELTKLRQVQNEYAVILQTRYEARTDLPSREDCDDFKKAMALVESYEKNHTAEHDPS